MPNADRYLEVTGARLRFRDSGSGPALVLVHGWTLDLEMWDPQVERLRQRYRLIRLDRRGHGLSSGHAAVAADAADIAALCDALGLATLGLLGMSQGARGALAFAAAAPQRVRALVLDGAPDPESAAPQTDIPLDHLCLLLRTEGIEAFRRAWQQHPLAHLRTREPAMQALLHAMLARYDGRDLRESTDAARGPRTASMPQIVTTPTLVLNGESDLPARCAAADSLCRQLPHAERAVVTGAGHLANLDDPDAYCALCDRFLSRHLQGSAWR